MWSELDRALSCAFSDPGFAYLIANWIWDDATAAGMTDVVDASSALLWILADDP